MSYDPTQTTSLEFSDFGSWYSPDGREHPITGQTTVSALPPLSSVAAAVASGSSTAQQQQQSTPASNTSSSDDGFIDKLLGKLFDKLAPQHIKARLVVGIIAVILLLIVAARFSFVS